MRIKRRPSLDRPVRVAFEKGLDEAKPHRVSRPTRYVAIAAEDKTSHHGKRGGLKVWLHGLPDSGFLSGRERVGPWRTAGGIGQAGQCVRTALEDEIPNEVERSGRIKVACGPHTVVVFVGEVVREPLPPRALRRNLQPDFSRAGQMGYSRA